MSTRSFVGVMSDAGILGAYVHGDGHPSWVGTQVQKILKRDGFEKFGQTILEGCEGGGFSWLDADTNANQEGRMSAYNKVTHGVIMNLCAEENVYREALATVGKYDDRDAQAHALRAFVQLLRCAGVVQTYSLTELRDADLDKVDWLAVAEGVKK